MLSIKKPTLVLNESICRNNIHAMATKALDSKVMFRPHFKTHQSATIGEWFRDDGATGITVSSVSMAEYFARHGWNDITIAFPVNILEIDEINQLASSVSLNLLIESKETAIFLSKKLLLKCGFFIKIDTGYHRTGIEAHNTDQIDSVLHASNSQLLHFKGFLTHSGDTYRTQNKQEIIRIQHQASENLIRLKKHYQKQFPDMLISVGDTPACSQLPIAEGIDEIRPGNFVFYDVMQYALGSCRLEDIAVSLVCPVVAVHPHRQVAIIYGGAVHLSKEQTSLLPYQEPIYGLAIAWNGSNWDTATLLGYLCALSQEHGIISLTPAGYNLKPGDLVAVLPVHSCLTANLMRKYFCLDGRVIETMNS